MKYGLILLFMTLSAQICLYGQLVEPNYINMKRQSMWPRNSKGVTVINVCWENISGTETEAQWVKQAIKSTWENVSNVSFTGWGKCGPNTRGIRIEINNAGHPHCKGLGTELDGMRAGMELNFNFQGKFKCLLNKADCIKFIATHEFGHALGLAHEHNRSDCRCEEPAQGGDGGWYVTPCDAGSIMNYCNPRWSNNGQLSDQDIKGIQVIYGKKSPGNVGENGNPGGAGVKNGIVVIKDVLGDDQLQETVYVELGGSGQQIFVNTQYPAEARTFSIAQPGNYVYKVWTTTVYKNKQTYSGYGDGQLYLQTGRRYNLDLVITGWNKAGYNDLQLINRNPGNDDNRDPYITFRTKSEGGGAAASLRVTNSGSRSIYVYWLDFEGRERYYFQLNPTEAFTQSTFLGHVWRVKDRDGQTLKTVEVRVAEQRCRVD